jgi:hypothetical protein
VVTRISEKWLARVALVFFFVICLPYVFFNTTRPLIAMKNVAEAFATHPLPSLGETKSSSIFYADAQTLLFVNASDLSKPYMEITNDIRNSGCAQVSLRIDSHDLEYTFWWLLKAPQSAIRIESLYYSNRLERYADPNFNPCAIICTICSGRTRLNGVNLFGSYDGVVNLYAGDLYNPLEDK